MDISYLLFLQDFRHTIHDAWTPFMQTVSLFAITYLVCIPVFIYWCVNKRKGLYTLASFYMCVAVNETIKLTACIYRPWVRDPRILPAGNATATAGGYSFPSGHTAAATPLYGGIAVGFWAQKATRWLSVLCGMGLLMTGFSRNYLGVHTPQDVAVGLMLGVLVLWAMARVFGYLEKYPQKENWFLLGGFLYGLLALIYAAYKPYPLDYMDGKLLADPYRMTTDAYFFMGGLMAFCVSRYVEKRWVRFTPTGLSPRGIFWGLLGFILAYALMHQLPGFCIWQWGPHAGGLVFMTVFVFYTVTFYPWVLKHVMRPRAS